MSKGGSSGNSSSGPTTTTRTVAEPWKGVQPFLTQGFKDATSQYVKGAPGYYPNATVAPLSGYTTSAIDWQADRAKAGSPLTAAAQGQLTKTMAGDYLDAGNPYFSRAVEGAIRPMLQQHQEVLMPQVDSAFAGAGRYGSDAHATAVARGNEGLLNQIGDTTSDMALKNYDAERMNQIRGMLFAPELAQQDYIDINALGQAGQGLDAYNQQQINASIDRYNYNQNAAMDWIGNYIGLLGNAPWGQTVTAQQPAPNAFTSALGGGLAGAGIGGAIGGPLGAGIGALGGGSLGWLFS